MEHDTVEYTHDEFEVGIERIANQVTHAGHNIDLIIGLARGGLVPAVRLSHILNVPRFEVVNASSHRLSGRSSIDQQVLDIVSSVPVKAQPPNILIVEDIVDSGTTMYHIIDSFRMAWEDSQEDSHPWKVPYILSVAALWYNTAQSVEVQFYDRQIDRSNDKRWVEFPWENRNGR